MKKIILILIIFLFFPYELHAGGYYHLPRSSKGLGRGGAFTAGVDDLSAVHYNPGRLALLDGLQFMVDSAFIFYGLDFTRAADPVVAPEGFETASNQADFFISPSVFIGYDFGLEDFYFSLAVYGAYGGDLAFDSMSPARYNMVYVDMMRIIYQLTASWKPVSWFSFGAGFQINDIRIEEVLKISSYTGVEGMGSREDPEYDITAKLCADNHFIPSGIFGFWFGPLSNLEIGMSLELPLYISAEGTTDIKFPSANPWLRNAYTEGNNVTIYNNVALVFNFGIQYKPIQSLELEADFVWENWDIHNKIEANMNDLVIKNIEGDINISFEHIQLEQNWQNTFSVRFGAEYELLNNFLWLRCGIYYDSSAIPDETLSVQWFDSDKIGMTFGASLKLWKFNLDLAYIHIFYFDREINNSQVKQINTIEPYDPELISIIGNGKYQAEMDTLALSVTFYY